MANKRKGNKKRKAEGTLGRYYVFTTVLKGAVGNVPHYSLFSVKSGFSPLLG